MFSHQITDFTKFLKKYLDVKRNELVRRVKHWLQVILETSEAKNYTVPEYTILYDRLESYTTAEDFIFLCS